MSSYSLVQRGTFSFGSGVTSPQDITLPTAVNLGSAFVNLMFRENRNGDAKGITATLTSATNLRLQFEGTIDASELIAGTYEVFDLDDALDSVNEILFRLERVLRENFLQDNIVQDDAGNIVSYRLRIFDTKVNAENATPGASAWPQTGERARIAVTQAVDPGKNDRKTLLGVITDVIPTPGVS